MKRSRPSYWRMGWVMAVLVLLILLAAVSFLLFTTIRLQQGLLKQDPPYSGSQLYSRALEQVQNGDYAQAEQYLEQALKKENDSTYRNQLAVVKYRLKKYEESIVQYEELVRQGKDVAFAYNGIGNAYRDWAEEEAAHKEVRHQKAIDAYRQASSADPQYVAAYSNLALLYHSRGESAKATAVLDEGIVRTGRAELTTLKATIMVQ